MKRFIWLLIIVALVGGIGAAAKGPLQRYWKERTRPRYRLAAVSRGSIVSVVNATGNVEPVLSVEIGSFVSGPIDELYADFNSEVKKDDLLAEIDPRIYNAAVARDRAALATAKAEVNRAKALWQQAKNNEERANALRADNENYISDTELDQFKFNRLSLEAQLAVAEASVQQAQANLNNSEANLNYTKILSPVDGIVIDRLINPGQTLAASFQTPVLFVVAPRMREEIHVFASVDEADIGLIKDARKREQPVSFTVDSYPEDLFEGTITQIRMSSTATENVVTYPVVVSAANPELKLMPGMTAEISFQIEAKDEIVRIPNAALRFYPPERERVHPDDRDILEGAEREENDSSDNDVRLSATQRAEARANRRRRHVWVVDGEFLRAVEVVTGLGDNKNTECVSGDLRVGQELVTGIKPRL